MRAHNNTTAQGFVLMLALVVLMIIVSLIVFLFEMSEISWRVSSNWRVNNQIEEVAKLGLYYSYYALLHDSESCQISSMSSADLYEKPLNWWLSVATCHEKWDQYRYQYVIEKLQTDLCQVIHSHHGVTFYRISVAAEPLHTSYMHIIQAVAAVPTVLSAPCQAELKTLHSVWQSWRVIK